MSYWRALKPVTFIACLIPLGQLLYNAWTDNLSANPIEFITHFTGDWTLIFLLASLSVTPLRQISGWNELIKYRRMLGLFAFFYVVLHFATYMVLDHFFDFQAIVKDVMDTLNYGEESVSVAMVEIKSSDWAEKVYKPDIVNNSAKLYKKPGYTLSDL